MPKPASSPLTLPTSSSSKSSFWRLFIGRGIGIIAQETKRTEVGSTKHYHIRIDGHLDPSWQAQFEDMKMIHELEGSTLLSGHLRDQAALYCVLLTIRRLGLTLLELSTSEALPLEESENRI